MTAQRKTMVVKIGSSTLVGDDRRIRRDFIADLARQARALRDMGWNLVVVSSGAIACGAPKLGFASRPADMPSLQACASVGQCILSAVYDEEFRAQELLTSLVLLTRHDTARRTSYLHARDALTRLVDLGVVPVVNENDTTTVDEIKFGDNDTLAALVSCLVSADLCVTLSDIDGLYTANPSLDPTATFIPRVTKIDAAIIGSAGDSTTSVGTGGMITKIRASRILMTAGIASVICSGEECDALVRLAAGESVGTLFAPPADRLDIAPRKLWIALGDSAHGSVVVDEGAARAVVECGSSLLPVGIRSVQGTFAAGDVLDVRDADGFVIARGRAAAGSDELELACGRRQDDIARNHLLAALAGKPAIHRDELIVFA
ncbi:glutamate 5-kinase [Collinsella sp. D33t1_170424_A12]|uniref:glutamate 5-kinase n=1 Tax=Collinsella sp. D33t1_170424_A12 TaxID=2787135 RepID=UPI00189BECCB|nr:glutamate 5-kinase [Collinsella sp. D33t1_170424_A12]